MAFVNTNCTNISNCQFWAESKYWKDLKYLENLHCVSKWFCTDEDWPSRCTRSTRRPPPWCWRRSGWSQVSEWNWEHLRRNWLIFYYILVWDVDFTKIPLLLFTTRNKILIGSTISINKFNNNKNLIKKINWSVHWKKGTNYFLLLKVN